MDKVLRHCSKKFMAFVNDLAMNTFKKDLNDNLNDFILIKNSKRVRLDIIN